MKIFVRGKALQFPLHLTTFRSYVYKPFVSSSTSDNCVYTAPARPLSWSSWIFFWRACQAAGKFRGVLVGVIAEEFCGVEMAVHGAGVAAVFREDEGALLCPHPQGPEIVMYAFHIAAALVEPAAGMIHEAAGVARWIFSVRRRESNWPQPSLKSTQRPMQGTL